MGEHHAKTEHLHPNQTKRWQIVNINILKFCKMILLVNHLLFQFQRHIYHTLYSRTSLFDFVKLSFGTNWSGRDFGHGRIWETNHTVHYRYPGQCGHIGDGRSFRFPCIIFDDDTKYRANTVQILCRAIRGSQKLLLDKHMSSGKRINGWLQE